MFMDLTILTNFVQSEICLMELMILTNFSQICQSKISLVELMILKNLSQIRQNKISLVDLMLLVNLFQFLTACISGHRVQHENSTMRQSTHPLQLVFPDQWFIFLFILFNLLLCFINLMSICKIPYWVDKRWRNRIRCILTLSLPWYGC